MVLGVVGFRSLFNIRVLCFYFLVFILVRFFRWWFYIISFIVFLLSFLRVL